MSVSTYVGNLFENQFCYIVWEFMPLPDLINSVQKIKNGPQTTQRNMILLFYWLKGTRQLDTFRVGHQHYICSSDLIEKKLSLQIHTSKYSPQTSFSDSIKSCWHIWQLIRYFPGWIQDVLQQNTIVLLNKYWP